MSILNLEKINIDKEALSILKIQLMLDLVVSALLAFTNPVVKLEMAKMVDPIYYQFANFLKYSLGIAINLYIGNKMISFIKNNFDKICIIDAAATIVVNLAFSHYANARFISLAILEVLIIGFVVRVFADIYNNLVKGTDLTILQSRTVGMAQLALLLGSGSIMIFTFLDINIDLDMALHLQCIALIIKCCINLLVTKRLIKYSKKKEE